MALAVLFAGACGILLLLARPNGAQDRPARAKPASHPIQVAGTERQAPTQTSPNTARRSLDFYTKGVRESMFSAPQPPKPKPVAVAPAPKPRPAPAPIVPVVEVNPFADWTYSGTVSMGDQKMALLENRTTKEGQYIKQGETFMGAQVTSISDQMVMLKSAGKPIAVAKSDTVNVTPLDKSAAYLTAQPQTSQPGQPQPGGPPQPGQDGQPAQWQGGRRWRGMMNGGQGGPSITLPNGIQLNGGRAQRYQQFMDRRF